MMIHSAVMAGLVPGIHVLLEVQEKTWMAGNRSAFTRVFDALSPAMTLHMNRPSYNTSMSQ